jgi:hypothetical protein
MDHLDGKPTLTNLFEEFWKPLISALKVKNPALQIVAEQANWADYGFEYFEKATVDRMFGFGLQQAILSFDKQQIINNAEIILNQTPAGKAQIIFIENHDIDRFASLETNMQRQKLAAARHPDGSKVYTLAAGLSLMIFYLLAMQCMSTLAVVKRETKSWKWPAFQLVYMTALAYGMSWLTYVLFS